ncbi:DUF6011 domain-containing protein [Streptomyces sp. NPDC002992]|uniref:DUF6011 domain-containing protein n=1 Tax=Streptomyces sp. NPDC002992 TaxID=3154273 RepID=UPI0033A3788D
MDTPRRPRRCIRGTGVPLPGHRRPRPLTGCESRIGGSPVHRTDRHDPRDRRHLHSGFLRPRPRPTERRRSVAVPVTSADQRGPSPTCQECGRPLTNELSRQAGYGPTCARYRLLCPRHEDGRRTCSWAATVLSTVRDP